MGEDAVAQLEKYRDRLAYVHLKDWTKGKFCLMGQGSVGLDFRSIRETLNAIGYQGWVMGELSSYADTDATERAYESAVRLYQKIGDHKAGRGAL
jgi:inosose dehydratase